MPSTPATAAGFTFGSSATERRTSGTKTNYEDAKIDAGPEFARAEELLDEWARESGLTPKPDKASRGYLMPGRSAAVVRLYPASGEPRGVLDLVGMDSARSEPLLIAIQERGGTVSDKRAYPSIPIGEIVDRWNDLVSTILDPLVEAWKAQLSGPEK